MTITIENPKLTHYVQSLLDSGAYASPQEVVEAALSEMSEDESDFDDETAARLTAACERGQGGEPGLSVAEARERLPR